VLFIELLGKYGVLVVAYPPEDLRGEVETPAFVLALPKTL
jgi:hypothetical protein